MKQMLIRWARQAGLAAGLIASVVAVAGWRTPPAGGALGLELAMTFQPSAQLELSPAGRVLTGSAMKPGDAVSGALRARNLTGVTLPLHVRALPSIPDLDRSLVIHVDADGRPLYDGPLGGLRNRSAATLRLASGATTTLHVSATLPAGATGWQGRIEKVELELR
jgi:hypothetical protein